MWFPDVKKTGMEMTIDNIVKSACDKSCQFFPNLASIKKYPYS